MNQLEIAGVPPASTAGGADIPPVPQASAATKRICLVDLSGVFRQHWHASESEGISSARGKTLQAVMGYASGFDAVGICIDTPPYLRSTLSPDYKAHREKAPAVMHETLRGVIEQLDRDGYHILGAAGYEADDIIARVCRWALETEWADGAREIVVYSSDKDLLQLVRPGVEVISSATGAVYDDEAAVVAKLGVKPALVPDWLALVGDKSDGIPGIKDVGPKKATAWLTEHGSLESVLLNADKLPERFRDAVKSGRDIIAKSYQLARLMDDAPINPEVLLEKKEAQRDEPAPLTDDVIDAPEVVTTMAADKPATALAVVGQQMPAPVVEFDRALEPRDSTGAFKLAKILFESRLFGNFPTPEAVLGIILAGRAHGLGAVQSLQSYHNVDGKPSASAQLIVGLCKRHPSCKYFHLVESSSTIATYETWREGEPKPTRMSFTIEQARLAGLLDKKGGTWLRHPDALLMARAGARLGRAVYPDVVGGLYCPDEMEDAR
jgi:hypothetical protein